MGWEMGDGDGDGDGDGMVMVMVMGMVMGSMGMAMAMAMAMAMVGDSAPAGKSWQSGNYCDRGVCCRGAKVLILILRAVEPDA